nr:hypothetical protein Iba_chr13fCG1840 [Ipomoea batatas]
MGVTKRELGVWWVPGPQPNNKRFRLFILVNHTRFFPIRPLPTNTVTAFRQTLIPLGLSTFALA